MNNLLNEKWQLLSSYIDNGDNILLSTHINADGDGVGSQVAFYYYLKQLEKKCRIINATKLPRNLNIIDPDNIVETYESTLDKWLSNVDLVILFDIGDHRRTGPIGDRVYKNSKIVSIDHHPVKEGHPFDLNIVDSKASSTGYMVWKYFQYLGRNKNKLSINIANGLYAAVVTDTGSFKYQSTSPDTHKMAAHLLESGVKGYEIQKSIYEQNKLSKIKLMGKVINSLSFSKNGLVAWSLITQDMIKGANGDDSDVDGFTEFIRSIQNVEIAFMIQEQFSGGFRINFRSSGNYIINDIAQQFGGGGHKFAAGARVSTMSSLEIQNKILDSLSAKIKEDF